MMIASNKITLSELQARIRRAVDGEFPFPLWVTAEISELKVNQSGHCYLELVEKGDGQTVPKAKASAVIWRNSYSSLSAYFKVTTGSDLAVGLKILCQVSVSYHELYGLSLVISNIDPSYTLGDWQAERQRTIDALHADGVWDMNRELPLPDVCQRIAVISSATAAGMRDFIKELGSFGFRFSVTLFEALVQGTAAEQSITDALCRIADRADEFDVVAIIRGGGSQSDLACFNSYRLCSYIAQFPLPILTGIGHDKDTSVADMVASTALKTPTAVADFLGDRAASTLAALEQSEVGLRNAVSAFFAASHQRLALLSSHTVQSSREVGHRVEMRLQYLANRIESLQAEYFKWQYERLELLARQSASSAQTSLQHTAEHLSALNGIVQANAPERILAHGFAVVRMRGRALRDAADATIGATAEIQLNKGKINAIITDNGQTTDLQ